jgi:hypothetical protein
VQTFFIGEPEGPVLWGWIKRPQAHKEQACGHYQTKDPQDPLLLNHDINPISDGYTARKLESYKTRRVSETMTQPADQLRYTV